ncbi:uncharacterized protein SCHCODRAFT_02692297 [Schizophyllum commune H4-8]|uniref:Expressed protein n=1 Tax=Schizophyllum commune (strain H4-8 / FGSC 9210) TaxID=578458 RepID=D8QFG4_SCHCM|nr:uncharacterized protein SCHCODRAFT_02692297 [Schizophyllum commune H4-8]KAI5887633.1 hypothetical protein SCHCODRAFT_02692297 [Schizophyllum commune H4-8]
MYGALKMTAIDPVLALPSTTSVSKIAERESHIATPPKTNSRIGLLTCDQYKNDVEARFLAPLSAAQRSKALISRANYDTIVAALDSTDPAVIASLRTSEIPDERAHYIRWAANTFTLAYGPAGLRLLENDRPVAVQDELYDILCAAHAAVDHGPFDATYEHLCAAHARIPRKLVAMFVRLCPTCLGAQSGNDNLVDLAVAEATMENDAKRAHDGSLTAIRKLVRTASEVSVSIVYGKENAAPEPVDHELDTDAETLAYSESVTSILSPISASPCPPPMRAPAHSAPARYSARGSALPPMKRQASLYAGLPNGWQFKFDDYGKARKHFVEDRAKGGRSIMALDTVVSEGDEGGQMPVEGLP